MKKEKETKVTEKILVSKEDIQKMFSDTFDNIANHKLSDSSFSDEQRGQVKEWLKEMYEIGVHYGETSAVLNGIGEEKLNVFLNSLQRMFGVNEKRDDATSEIMYYRMMYYYEKGISNNLHMQLGLMTTKLESQSGDCNAVTSGLSVPIFERRY